MQTHAHRVPTGAYARTHTFTPPSTHTRPSARAHTHAHTHYICQHTQLEEYIQSDLVNPTNKHVAACVLSSLRANQGVLTAESVLAYTMKTYNTVYSAVNSEAKASMLSDPANRNHEPFPWYETEMRSHSERHGESQS